MRASANTLIGNKLPLIESFINRSGAIGMPHATFLCYYRHVFVTELDAKVVLGLWCGKTANFTH